MSLPSLLETLSSLSSLSSLDASAQAPSWAALSVAVGALLAAVGGAVDTAAKALVLPVAAAIFVNQLDELFMDANYLLRGLHRRAGRTIPWRALEQVRQKHIAILVPAWHEDAVIRRMLEHNLANIDYNRTRYTLFCGTYVNDPDTQREVDEAAHRFPGVRKVVVPHDGPTSKADCLNWIYQGVVLEEQRRGRRYDILLMHDAEDVIHPLALRLYSLLIPRYEFVQTPVFSLSLGLRQGVAATYIDEFAEHHLKDMLVREAIGGLIPSAGVGSAFDRQAFADIARAHGERPFNVESLTEDYEIGLKFRLAGKRVHFACHAVEATPLGSAVTASGPVPATPAGASARPARRRRPREELIATREYFPDGFSASVRQRSRWILGIALQTWRQVGWPGSLPVLYCLWRDRKALFTNTLVSLAYLLVGYGALRAVGAAFGMPAADLAPGGWRGSLLHALFVMNLAALGWRIAVKAQLVGRLHGFGHAVLSAPRMVLANFISLRATGRAVGMFVAHRVTGKPLRWLKTAHAFPSPAILRARQRRLGEILTEEYGLDLPSLELALSLQQSVRRPLGDVLSLMGLVPEQTVTRALAQLHEMGEGDPWAGRAPDHLLIALGEAEAERLGVVPLAAGPDGGIRVAAEAPLGFEDVRALEERLGDEVELVLAPPAAVRRSRQQAFRRLLAGGLDGASTPVVRRRLRPEEVDWRAVARIGHGYCAFYAILPLLPGPDLCPHFRPGRGAARTLAAAFPVHAEVLAAVARRLRPGSDDRADSGPREGQDEDELAVVPTPLLDIDVAMALCPSASTRAAAAPGAETLELLRSLAANDDGGDDDHDPRLAACRRAAELGLPIGPPSAAGPVHWEVLPPELRSRDPIFIHGLADRSLVLSTASPSPRLFRTVGNLYPRWSIAWRVELPDARDTPPTEELPCTSPTPSIHPSLSN